MIEDLIYDVGMHNGDDTDFYVKKGFRVIGIEANPALCHQCADRFADAVASSQLIIVNQAIAEQPGEIDFYVNELETWWGTASKAWADRWEKQGFPSTATTVEATTMAQVLETHGVPYFMKIDIEGFEQVALDGLLEVEDRPRFVSIESSAVKQGLAEKQLDVFERLGYTKFKIVSMHQVSRQQCVQPATEGSYVDHDFKPGVSGLFGSELPGEWLTLSQARSAHRRIAWQTRIVGPHTGILRRAMRNRYAKGILRRIFPAGVGWYDTHATY